MAGEPIDSPPRRTSVFDYVTSIDPVMSTFGWKIVGLAHVAMVLPVLGVFFPREAPLQWDWIAVVIGIVAIIGAINVVSFNKMVHSRGYRSPPVGLVLIEIVLATVAAAVLSYAVGGTTSIYRPLIFVPALLAAMIGNRWMILLAWVVATMSVTVSAVASGVVQTEVVAILLSYGGVWGIVLIMVHLLALAALHSDDQVGGLADLAGIAARANNLADGITEVSPVITALTDAERTRAFRVVVDGETPDAVFRFEALIDGDDASVDAPTVTEIDEARSRQGVAIRNRRAVLVAEGAEGDVVAIVLEGIPGRPFDQLRTRFNLERIVTQVDVLVNRSRYVAHLEDLGRTDGLTGLANRRSLFDKLDAECAVAQRRDEALAVVMTDLDHFKTYNDTFGHLAGDDLLRRFAVKLGKRVRSVDFVARYGGEEFVLVLPDTDGPGAEILIDQLQRRFRVDPELEGVTFSAGVAVWDGSERVDALIDRADRALYAAKSAGRDRMIVNITDAPRSGRSTA